MTVKRASTSELRQHCAYRRRRLDKAAAGSSSYAEVISLSTFPTNQAVGLSPS